MNHWGFDVLGIGVFNTFSVLISLTDGQKLVALCLTPNLGNLKVWSENRQDYLIVLIMSCHVVI